MKKYRVKLKAVGSLVVEIEANDEDEAEDLVWDQVRIGLHECSEMEFVDTYSVVLVSEDEE